MLWRSHGLFKSFVSISFVISERMWRNQKARWAYCLGIFNIEENTPLSVRACSKYKENLQVLSTNFFQQMSENVSTKIVPSGYVTYGQGTRSCFECIYGRLSQRNDLESDAEETDGQLVGHIGQALMTGIMRSVIFHNDTDVVMFLLYQMHEFF